VTALFFDRSTRLRMLFSGAKAAESLTGLVTNDVLSLRGGDGQYACALTPKGRMIADVRILAIATGDGAELSLLVDANPAAGVGFAAMIRKYVNPRLAKYVDVTASTACLTLVGPESLSMLATLSAAAGPITDVRDGVAFTHRLLTLGGLTVRLVRIPDLGAADAFDLHCDAPDASVLRDLLLSAGAVPGDDGTWDRLRVLAGRPEWGVDMDDSTLAQEANMDALEAISYKKGCYTGQETVARVHFRGHVNRTLRRVRFAAETIPPQGAPLLDQELKPVGDVRSTALSDDGQRVGIAMVRREVPDAGELTWASADGATWAVTVVGAADEA
jgi:folate-binding protein YgfZ